MYRIFSLSLLLLLVATISITPASEKISKSDQDKAGKSSQTPADRVEQLLHTLQEDRKEDQRAKAAEELPNFTSQEFPEIVPALINALVSDNSASVRKTVVKALADIKPPTHEIKDALDQAVKQDKSWSVRQSARWAAWRYKPKDQPATTTGSKVRATSKPDASGKVAADDLKNIKLIAPPIPLTPVGRGPDEGVPNPANSTPPPPPIIPLPGGSNPLPPPPAE